MDIVTLIIIAVAIALDPLPLVPFILLLSSKRGVRKGAAFLFGWFVVPWALSPLLKRLDAKRAAKERRQHRRRHRRSRHAGAQAPPSGETAADTSDPL